MAFTGEKVKGSLEIDNFIIDFSHENEVAGVDTRRVQNNRELSRIDVGKDMPAGIKEANPTFVQSKELSCPS